MTGAPKTHQPQNEANFLSKIFIWWIFPLLWKGVRNPLNHEDLYPIREVEKSGQRTDLLEEKWCEEILSARSLGREPKLWRAILRYYTLQEYLFFVPLVLASLLGDNIVCFATINLLRQLTNFYDNEPHGEYFVYIYGIAIGCLMKLIGQNHMYFHGNVLGVRARAGILGLLYRKVLRLSKTSLDSGHVMELVCNDSQRILTSAKYFFPYAIRHVLFCACAIAWLLYFVGWQIIPGAMFLLAVGVSRMILNEFDYKLRKRASQLSDERLGLIRETLTVIHSVKLNCWETIYEGKIRNTRWQEVTSKTKRWIIMLTSYSFISCGQHLGTFITVLVLALTQKENIPNLNFFAMIVLFRELSEKLCMCLPTSISYVTNVRTAFQRMELFLQWNDSLNFERDSKRSVQFNIIKNIPDTVKKVSAKTPLLRSETYTSIEEQINLPKKALHEVTSKPHDHQHEPPYLSLHEVTCELPSRVSRQSPESNCTEILNDITLKVATPGLVLVCGPVGSGKSSLLTTVLGGELLVTNGFVKYLGTLAYVSDTPWVFSGTIRENIIFGFPYNEKFYAEIITACQLEKDFKTFPQNDLALIGEHGATVSGGQRTRIALARAVYSQADIYLLDDPLSSLDANVAENVFRHCIRGLLSSRIVLLTTHDTRYYQEADHIIHLTGGKIEEFKTDQSLAEFDLLQKNRTPDEKKAGDQDVWRDYNEEEGTEMLKQEEEEREIGRVAFKVYKEYFLYGVSAIVLFIIFLVFYSGQGMIVLVDFKASRLPVLASQVEKSFDQALLVYTLCVTAGVVLMVLGTLCIFLVLMNAAYKVHNKMVTCLLKAPLSFHAINPVGRVLNRFSQDINNVDELLPFYVFMLVLYAVPAVATVLLAAITTPLLIIPIIIALPVFYFFSNVYFTSATDIKRLVSIAGSPIYSHFSNTMEGLRNIRVYGRQKDFIDQVFRHIDEHHRAAICSAAAIRWFANAFSIVCITIATIITIIVMYSIHDSISAALGAMTILYAVNTTHSVYYVVMVTSDVNSQMTSAERVLAYTRIQTERGQDLPKTPPQNWPHAGEIELKDVSLWHYTGGPYALKNLTFKIHSSEKVGIVGRTGAGKSSLVAALMRLAETRGEILIDGLNIKEFNMLSTRKCVSVISQSPTLINGTIRLNLDPFGQHTDAEIWNALHQTKMSSTVKNLPRALDCELNIDNSKFSVGEKQLLNLARVLLQNNKIVIFDEATGKIDGNTGKEIQRIIDDVFKQCTVITIAHRLSSILHCDRVMVLDQGEINEFDRPAVLLMKPSGLLKQLQEKA